MKIMLKNTQAMLGDRLMFTPAVRDLKLTLPDCRVNVISMGREQWLNNPHLDPAVTEQNADHVFNIGPGKVTRGSKTNGLHIAQAFGDSLEEQLFEAGVINRPMEHGPIRADLHLSRAEKDLRLIDGHYWVINIDTGPFSAKRWPAERFQKLVEALPEITFVQVGLSQDNAYRLTGHNVIDMIDRTKMRELFSLVYNADGCVSLVSSLMHIAGAFQKPCVVIAGGREPDTFERYPNHRFIDNVGTLPCCRNAACWHNALDACVDHDCEHAYCMRLIKTYEVENAIESYYQGGAVIKPGVGVKTIATRKPVLRIVANAKCLGGAERSVAEIARLFDEKNWRVEFTVPGDYISPEVPAAMPDSVKFTKHVTRPCDVLLLYASDQVFNFDQARYDVFERIEAGRKVMALTYKLGKVGKVPWTRDWDRYLFLSSTLDERFHQLMLCERDVTIKPVTQVLAPAVDLDPFLKCEPNYNKELTIARHSSQGGKKFPADLAEIIKATPGAQYIFRPGCEELYNLKRCEFFGYDSNVERVAYSLSMANCYWYLLPAGYADQGPRAIVEAMAAGLAVIAENRDGAADRVTPDTGWLIDDHAEAVEIINALTPEILESKGKAARARALEHFDPAKWFGEISG